MTYTDEMTQVIVHHFGVDVEVAQALLIEALPLGNRDDTKII
jgi:hypothetical protein